MYSLDINGQDFLDNLCRVYTGHMQNISAREVGHVIWACTLREVGGGSETFLNFSDRDCLLLSLR